MTSPPPPAGPITGLVPMLHVADVARAITFYRMLGFEVGNYVPRTGPMEWAWLYASKANWKSGPNLMLTHSDESSPPRDRFVLYFYATHLESLRTTLLEQGARPTAISYPDYLPAGEFRVEDPDGYTLMIAQSSDDTP